MTILINLKPEEEQALVARARMSGKEPAQYAQQIIRDHISRPPAEILTEQPISSKTIDDLIDHEFVAECASRHDRPVPTIKQVREILAKISGTLAEEILADREDRF